MPELPPSHKRPPVERPPTSRGSFPRIAELHCKTNFSFLEGASHADEFALRAAEWGFVALAITDRNTLAGMCRAHGRQVAGSQTAGGGRNRRARRALGRTLDHDRAAYGRFARLITRGRRQAPKGEFHLTFDELALHAEGLLAGVLPGNRKIDGSPPPANDDADQAVALQRQLARYRELFDDRCYLLAELTKGADDQAKLAGRVGVSRRGEFLWSRPATCTITPAPFVRWPTF